MLHHDFGVYDALVHAEEITAGSIKEGGESRYKKEVRDSH